MRWASGYRVTFCPPATVITPTMINPVRTKRTPGLTPNVFSMVSSSTRNKAAP